MKTASADEDGISSSRAVPNEIGDPRYLSGLQKRSPLGKLVFENYASRLPSITGYGVVTARGIDLAETNRVFVSLYDRRRTPIYHYEATLVGAADDHLDVILPNVDAWTDGYMVMRAYRFAEGQAPYLLAEGNELLESAAPGIFTLSGSGIGAPLGSVVYREAPDSPESEGSVTEYSLDEPLVLDATRTTGLTLWTTSAIPVRCNYRSQAKAFIRSEAGTREVPISYFADAGEGYQQLNLDLTEMIRVGGLRGATAKLYLRVQDCGEQVVVAPKRLVDSNEVTLRLTSAPAPVTEESRE